jgi:hypothetical protein
MRPTTRRLVSGAGLTFIASVAGLVLALIFQWPAQLGGGSGNPNITPGGARRKRHGDLFVARSVDRPYRVRLASPQPALVGNHRGGRPLSSRGALYLRRAGRGVRAAHAVRSSRGTHRGRRGVRRAGAGFAAVGHRGADRQGAGGTAISARKLGEPLVQAHLQRRDSWGTEAPLIQLSTKGRDSWRHR